MVGDITMHGAVARLVVCQAKTPSCREEGPMRKEAFIRWVRTCMLGVPTRSCNCLLYINYTGMDASTSTPGPGGDLNDL